MVLMAGLVFVWLSVRYIPHNKVGVVEKLWSSAGSVSDGRILALHGEAGYQVDLMRGGLHFGMWRWQYRLHKVPLVTIRQGRIGYVYARDGESLPPSQTLGRIVECNNFQDARTFLGNGVAHSETEARGQRGRQRAILREGVYAINPALFVVMTEDAVYSLRHLQPPQEVKAIADWQRVLSEIGGFSPVVIGGVIEAQDALNPEKTIHVDGIGITTIHDGPSLEPGTIIAPPVGNEPSDPHYHNNFQDPEAFLRAGGRRGRQYQPLTDGTYFINRWFATVQMIPKTVVPIGYVGVVVSYYGKAGRDLSGTAFRHGERVAEGERGVWEKPLGPGKYAFNTYAGSIILVPTTNFVLHWITGKTESHRYDESLKSIDLVTKDAYEPSLPLSVVVHIDYQRAPSVIQRFGDVKKLITQTLDPMLSAYFRDIAHKKTMLELLHDRDKIQMEAREELCRKFHDFDIECVDVLIGKPDTAEAGGKIESLLEQLRVRQLSIEQLETYARQRDAVDQLKVLNEAQAHANMQTQLTNARVQIDIAESLAAAELAKTRKQAEQTIVLSEAELARSRRQAEQTIVLADAELARSRRAAEQTVVTAEAASQERILAGRGESQRVMQVGLAEASVLLKKIGSFGDPRLYALSQMSAQLARSTQPLVPERVFVSGGESQGTSGGMGQGLVGLLLNLLVAEKSGFHPAEDADQSELKEISQRMTREALASMERNGASGEPGADLQRGQKG
ncbi:MAG: SPFH domain-containing protein [Planctomycetales bacterium]